MVSECHYTWKIIAGGPGGVGKTTFLLRYLTDQFVANTSLTVGVQLHSHTLEVHGKRIGLILWDLGGQERFRIVQPAYMRGAVGAFIFYDTSRLTTLFELKDWIELMRETAGNIPILLVGTKTDIVDDEMLDDATREGRDFAKQKNLAGFILTSSKTGQNIQQAVAELVQALIAEKEGKKPESGLSSSSSM